MAKRYLLCNKAELSAECMVPDLLGLSFAKAASVRPSDATRKQLEGLRAVHEKVMLR